MSDLVDQVAKATVAQQTGRRYPAACNCGQWFVGPNLVNRFERHMRSHSRTIHPSNRGA